MGSKPKAPDMSAQVNAANEQKAQLEKQTAEQKAAAEALAMKNTDKLTSARRGNSGRRSLISTSEQGLTESNALGV